MDIEVDSQDVIKIILQFLKENNLHNSMKALQQETNVSLNVVDDLDNFISDIHNGKWNKVLETVSSIGISSQVLFDLFEQIFFELIEMNEIDSARSLLYNSQPLICMKTHEMHDIRYSRLEQILLNSTNKNNNCNTSELYGYGSNKEKKRKEIAEMIEKEVFEVAPSRLLSLLNDSLKYQQLSGNLIKGENYDLFKDYDDLKTDENKKNKGDRSEKIIRKNTIMIPFSKHSSMTYITFSTDGNLLVSGSSDGFIEIWDYDKGQLIKDSNVLTYQSSDKLLLHCENVAVRYITFSNDSQLMASGDDNGCIKIWKIYSGINCITFGAAHCKSVTCLSFNNDGTQILSSSIDHSIKIHGLKSKRILKEFKGHKSFVNKVLYMNNYEGIVSCCADGSIRIWNAETTDCIHQINNIHKMAVHNIANPMEQYLDQQYASNNNNDVPAIKASNVISIRSMIANPMNKQTKEEEVYVILSSNSYVIYLLNVKTGKLIKKMESEKLKKYVLNKQQSGECEDHYFGDIVSSAYGNYLYVLGEPDHILYCFNTLKKNKKKKNHKESDFLSNAIKIHNENVTRIAHHPHRNILASISNDRKLKIWRA